MVEKMFKNNIILALLFSSMILCGCASKNGEIKNADSLGELELNLPVKKFTLDNGASTISC